MPPTTKTDFHTLASLLPVLGATFAGLQAAARAAAVEPAFTLNGVPYFTDESVARIREALRDAGGKAKAKP